MGWGSSLRACANRTRGATSLEPPEPGGAAAGTRAPPEPWESQIRAVEAKNCTFGLLGAHSESRVCVRVCLFLCACVRLEGGCDPCAVPWRRLRVGVRSSFITPQGLCLLCTLRVTCQCKCPPGSRRLVMSPQESCLCILATGLGWHSPLWSKALGAKVGPLLGCGQGP